MKQSRFPFIYAVLIACTTLFLSSCDSNKGKVKELAELFISSYNDGDKAAVYDLFPTIKMYDNLTMNGTIGNDNDISVLKDDSTGNYIVTINKQKQQKLVFAVDSIGDIKIVDTYSVFRLDDIANELALKTGVPVKKFFDIEIAKLMNPESDYINDLKLKNNSSLLWTNSGAYSWGHNSSGAYVSMDFTVTNLSSQTINGKDYFLVVTPKDNSTGQTYAKKTIDGIDLAPNEVREFKTNEPGLYRIANSRNLGYTVEVKYRTESILTFLLNYGKIEGNEYEDYLAHPYRVKVQTHGSNLVVSAEKEGYAYMYKDMSEESEVVDTFYHGKPISIVWESEKWASVYDYDYQLKGYMQEKNIDLTNTVPMLDLAEMKLISPDGKVKVYDENGENVIKTIPAGKKALLELQEWGNVILYERQSDGSMKMIGYVNSENVDYDE